MNIQINIPLQLSKLDDHTLGNTGDIHQALVNKTEQNLAKQILTRYSIIGKNWFEIKKEDMMVGLLILQSLL